MINQFLSFDKLIGSKLITILYYLGLIGIALGVLGGIFGALAMLGVNFLGGIGTLIVVLIGGAVGVLFWRFICEIYMLFFRIADDLRDIKNAKAPPTL